MIPAGGSSTLHGVVQVTTPGRLQAPFALLPCMNKETAVQASELAQATHWLGGWGVMGAPHLPRHL